MSIKRPRGTKDIYGLELNKIQEICEKIRNLFSIYGYSEIQTPIFEHVDVFGENDEAFLSANKELFEIKSRNSQDTEYVLRPENTASIVRAAWENKIINPKVNYSLGFFYEGPYFRYERPQQGRFRQFIQMGIEKLNSNSPEDDVWNILLIQELQRIFNLKLTLKINYLGSKESKKIWNEKLRIFFKQYENELSETSRKRLCGNTFRILDDKEDSKKKFVRNAPRIEDCFREQEIANLTKLKTFLSDLKIDYVWDEKLVRGIDYYTGLIYEWIDEKTGITIVAGGRYDCLFERFDAPNTPSLGLAIGIDRLKMIIDRDESYEWKKTKKYLYLFPYESVSSHYLNWSNECRKFLIAEKMDVICIVSNSVFNPEKHKKIASKYPSREDKLVIFGKTNKQLSREEQHKEFLEIKKFLES